MANDESMQPNPWEQNLPGPNDTVHAQAVQGYKRGVAMGVISPDDGLARLKKLGAVPDHVNAEDLLGPQAAPPARAPSSGGPWAVGSVSHGENPILDMMMQGEGMGAAGNMSKSSSSRKEDTTSKKSVSSQRFDPGDYELRQAVSMGYPVKQKIGSFGELMVDAGGKPLYDVGDTPDPRNPVQQQIKGMQGLQDLLKMSSQQRAEQPLSAGINLAPLAGLANTELARSGVHGQVGAGYVAPENPSETQNRMMGEQAGLLKERMGLQKSITDNLRTTQPTLTYNDVMGLNQQNASMTGSQQGNPTALIQLARLLQGQQRIDQRGALSAQTQFNKDSILNTYQQRIDGADKIMHLMDAADDGKVASTQAMLGQLNAEIARLETGAQAPGLHSAEKTEMQNFEAQLSAIRDRFTGAQTSVDLKNAFTQARAMVGDLRHSYIAQQESRRSMLSSGALPSQTGVFTQKGNALNMQNEKNEPKQKINVIFTDEDGNEHMGKWPADKPLEPGMRKR